MPPKKEVVLRLSSQRYLKTGISEADFHEYGSKVHAPRAAEIQASHGALRVSQVYTPSICRDLFRDKIPWAVRPGWNIDDHDMAINIWVRTTDQMLAIVMDPDFQALVAGDNEYIDSERGTISAGWEDGKVVNVEDGNSLYPAFDECVRVGNASQTSVQEASVDS
ncbi:hypothetical protein CC86DRAFT_355534 [Ophiobolus disseminans]|uniref:EthD domain-containing protein n=1 Tax=Ophiobolus disseminans TaxID=1469910 RepID=A0A6A6ZSM5_9PLEO|nr:hypothetical protein CC86DRAFT_355534 [Ophiobolus disseminans]